MLEVFTNPITLLCLGVVFLLISILFFYFKRSVSLLERAQMEQARILQSFITNMEMSQHMALNRGGGGGGVQHTNSHSISTEKHPLSTQSSDQQLIDVSDEDSDSGSDDDDDSDGESDDDTLNNENVSAVSSKIPIIEISELEHDTNDIKVIQLPENTLEEFNLEVLDMNTLSWLDKRVNKQADIDESDDNSSINDSIADSIQSLSEEEQQIVDEVKKEKIPIADYKTLSVQTLRQIAEDNELIKKGEKKTKKELLSLLENTKK